MRGDASWFDRRQEILTPLREVRVSAAPRRRPIEFVPLTEETMGCARGRPEEELLKKLQTSPTDLKKLVEASAVSG